MTTDSEDEPIYSTRTVKKMLSEARADERAKYNIELNSEPCDKCKTLFMRTRHDTCIDCLRKEAYAKGQADLIEELEAPLATWAGGLYYTIYDDGVRCQDMNSDMPSNFKSEGCERIAKSIIKVIRQTASQFAIQESCGSSVPPKPSVLADACDHVYVKAKNGYPDYCIQCGDDKPERKVKR